jgi:hypothetical protein
MSSSSQNRRPYALPLVALHWDRIYEGLLMRRDPGPLTPDYLTVLSIISELAFVCGLALSDTIETDVVETDEESTGEPTLVIPYAPAEGFLLKEIPEEESDQSVIEEGLRERGPDWLGRYYHKFDEPERIELHLSRCWRTAKFLGLRAKDLAAVVLAHEAAHFVSHIGIGGYKRRRWEDFSKATTAQVEHAAQVASWGLFTVFERPDFIKVMRKLANYQSDVYNSWREFEKRCGPFLDKPLETIGAVTLEVGNASGRY